MLSAVSLALLAGLLGTVRAHRGLTESDSVDLLRSHDRRSLQIEQNVWLRDLSTALSRAVSQADVARIMSEQGAVAAGCSVADITLRKPGSRTITMVRAVRAPYGPFPERPPSTMDDRMPVADAIRSGANVLVLNGTDLSERYPDFAANQALSHDETLGEGAGDPRSPVDASASIPLVDSEGQVIGAMGFGWSSTDSFDDGRLVLLETATELCARALDRVRLYELEYEARRLAENLQAFTTVLAATQSRAARSAMVFDLT